jgi:hypothetical protein
LLCITKIKLAAEQLSFYQSVSSSARDFPQREWHSSTMLSLVFRFFALLRAIIKALISLAHSSRGAEAAEVKVKTLFLAFYVTRLGFARE